MNNAKLRTHGLAARRRLFFRRFYAQLRRATVRAEHFRRTERIPTAVANRIHNLTLSHWTRNRNARSLLDHGACSVPDANSLAVFTTLRPFRQFQFNQRELCLSNTAVLINANNVLMVW